MDRYKIEEEMLNISAWFYSRWRFLSHRGWKRRAQNFYNQAVKIDKAIEEPPQEFYDMYDYIPTIIKQIVGKKIGC